MNDEQLLRTPKTSSLPSNIQPIPLGCLTPQRRTASPTFPAHDFKAVSRDAHIRQQKSEPNICRPPNTSAQRRLFDGPAQNNVDVLPFPVAFALYMILFDGLVVTACGIVSTSFELAFVGFLILMAGCLAYGRVHNS